MLMVSVCSVHFLKLSLVTPHSVGRAITGTPTYLDNGWAEQGADFSA